MRTCCECRSYRQGCSRAQAHVSAAASGSWRDQPREAAASRTAGGTRLLIPSPTPAGPGPRGVTCSLHYLTCRRQGLQCSRGLGEPATDSWSKLSCPLGLAAPSHSAGGRKQTRMVGGCLMRPVMCCSRAAASRCRHWWRESKTAACEYIIWCRTLGFTLCWMLS
jgi:hypothetical protein